MYTTPHIFGDSDTEVNLRTCLQLHLDIMHTANSATTCMQLQTGRHHWLLLTHETVSVLSPTDIQEFHLRLNVAEGDVHYVLLQSLKVHLSCNPVHIHWGYIKGEDTHSSRGHDIDIYARHGVVRVGFKAGGKNTVWERSVAKSCTHRGFSSQSVPIAFWKQKLNLWEERGILASSPGPFSTCIISDRHPLNVQLLPTPPPPSLTPLTLGLIFWRIVLAISSHLRSDWPFTLNNKSYRPTHFNFTKKNPRIIRKV